MNLYESVKSNLKESVTLNNAVMDSYHHFMDDLGRTPSISEIIDDLKNYDINNLPDGVTIDDTEEDYRHTYAMIKNMLNGLDYINEGNNNKEYIKEDTDRVEISLGPEKRYVIPGSPEENTLRAVKNTLKGIEDKVSVLALDQDHAEVGFANKASGISYISAEFDGSGNIIKLTTNAAIIDKDFLDLANTLYAKMHGGI